MLIAGEASGDLLAAELVSALLAAPKQGGDGRAPQFFGAGGAKMSAAGVELVHEMSQLSVVGITDVFKKIFEFRRLLRQLLAAAIERKPDVVIGVDFGGFNLRFAHAVKEHVRSNPGGWNPKIVQFISPQVWASRPKRAERLAADCDLLLSIFPFEKDWYAQRTPQLRVEFVGHPMVGRFIGRSRGDETQTKEKLETPHVVSYEILLLPGSRRSELKNHLPAMLGALNLIQEKFPSAKAKMVLPDESLVQLAKSMGVTANVEIQIGDLPQALAQADIAIAKTGTVTMECAFFDVPAVTLYKGSWLNYQIARRLITVKTFTMPNLLAGEEVYPEFLQDALTAENLSRAALELLQDESRRSKMKSQLAKIVESLGEPGAANRAAAAILSLLK